MNNDIHKFFTQYWENFNNKNYNELVDYFYYPCLIIFNQSVEVFSSEEGMRKNLERLITTYDKQGYYQASFKLESEFFFDENNQIVTLLWTVQNRNNTMTQFRCNYQLIHKDNSIKIIVITSLEGFFNF